MRMLRATLAFLALGLLAQAGENRVVSQTVGSDELLLALAESSEVAALSHLADDARYSGVASAARAFPRLGAAADAEAVLAFRPTLVLLADYSRADLRTQLERAGVPVLVFSRYATLDDCFANLRSLGARLGPQAATRAETLIAQLEQRVGALRTRLAHAPRVRVLAPSIYGYLPGRDTTFQDLCDHAQAENVASSLGGLAGHAPQPSELMLTWPVDFLVLGAGDDSESLARLRESPPYRFMDVVKAGRTVSLPHWQLSCVSHLRVEAYEALARQLHPALLP